MHRATIVFFWPQKQRENPKGPDVHNKSSQGLRERGQHRRNPELNLGKEHFIRISCPSAPSVFVVTEGNYSGTTVFPSSKARNRGALERCRARMCVLEVSIRVQVNLTKWPASACQQTKATFESASHDPRGRNN